MRPLLSLLMVLALSATASTPVLAFFGPPRVIAVMEGILVQDPAIDTLLHLGLVVKPGTPEEKLYILDTAMGDVMAISTLSKLSKDAPVAQPGSAYLGSSPVALSGLTYVMPGRYRIEVVGQVPTSAEIASKVLRSWKARVQVNEHGAAEALKLLEDQGLLEGMVQDLLEVSR